MTLVAGTRLGPYEIVAPLGAGGMGEVYRARDSKLNRDVAIKILPEPFAADPAALARFEREAQAVAALSHPNILSIFDFGRQSDTAYAVMELLEGETLRVRLARGALPTREAVEFAVQIAHGLAAAHENGIVHRDLKPENLWVTRDFRIKILDFGLAKQMPGRTGDAARAAETTGVSNPTAEGTIVGTLGYMSPEQVRGEPLDGRSDLFSVGVVLFEMLTGTKTFARSTASETMAAILRDHPPGLDGAGGAIPSGLQRVVSHCLEKEPRRRFQGAEDLAFALETSPADSGLREVLRDAPSSQKGLASWRTAAIGLLCLAVGAAAAWTLRPSAAPDSVVSLRFLTYGGRDASPSASPDGQTVAFTSDRDGRPRIWLKQVHGGGEMALTAGPDDDPRFSPDGASVLFTRTEGKRTSLYRTTLIGGAPRKIVEDAFQGDWSPDEKQIAFLRLHEEESDQHIALCVVDPGGSSDRQVARFPAHFVAYPRWSPDGRFILLSSSRSLTPGGIRKLIIVDAKDGSSREVQPPHAFGILSSAIWVSTGDIAYLQAELPTADGTSVSPARAYSQNVRTGECRTLFWTANFGGVVDLLPTGVLVFDGMSGRQNLREYALEGSAPPRWLTRGHANDRQPVFDPGGDWVVFSSDRSGNLDLWAVSTRTGALHTMTEDPADDWDPGFSPDGRSLLWSSSRSGHLEVWGANSDGTGARRITDDGEDAENPTATLDGRWVVYSSSSSGHYGLWKIHPDGTGVQQLSRDASLSVPEVSPDGVHVLYQTQVQAKVSIRVARVEDGGAVPFVIWLDAPATTATITGRARWMPDGNRIIFTGQDERGRLGVFAQDFVPGRDTTATRRRLAGFDPDWATESLGLSRDGKRLVLSESEHAFNLMIADGVPGLARRGRTR